MKGRQITKLFAVVALATGTSAAEPRVLRSGAPACGNVGKAGPSQACKEERARQQQFAEAVQKAREVAEARTRAILAALGFDDARSKG